MWCRPRAAKAHCPGRAVVSRSSSWNSQLALEHVEHLVEVVVMSGGPAHSRRHGDPDLGEHVDRFPRSAGAGLRSSCPQTSRPPSDSAGCGLGRPRRLGRLARTGVLGRAAQRQLDQEEHGDECEGGDRAAAMNTPSTPATTSGCAPSPARWAKTAPSTAAPTAPPSARKNPVAPVATPRSRRSTLFCTARTSTWVTIPKPSPNTASAIPVAGPRRGRPRARRAARARAVISARPATGKIL